MKAALAKGWPEFDEGVLDLAESQVRQAEFL